MVLAQWNDLSKLLIYARVIQTCRFQTRSAMAFFREAISAHSCDLAMPLAHSPFSDLNPYFAKSNYLAQIAQYLERANHDLAAPSIQSRIDLLRMN